MNDILKAHMSSPKKQLLSDSLDQAKHYLEYGVGGSTAIAAQSQLASILAVDSDKDWLDKVREVISQGSQTASINLIHVDLGPTTDWGYPIERTLLQNWPKYYSSPWTLYRREAITPDLIFIDGRFRVACFLYCILQCAPGTRILWDDYTNRTEYHLVENILAPQGVVDDLAIFSMPQSINAGLTITTLFENLFNLD